jgi:hypothetical protein
VPAPTTHEAGCTYGGFSCGYWLVVDGCDEYHPETHYVTDDYCPCGHEFAGAGTMAVVYDAHDRPLPEHLRTGIGSSR